MIDLLSLLAKVLLLFFKTPSEKRKDLFNDLNGAFKKALDDKNPTNLSKLLNS